MPMLFDSAGAVAYDYIVHHWLVAIPGIEFLFGSGDKRVVEVVLHQVDGAAAEAATHDARAGDATLLGYVIEVVKLLTAHLVKFRHTFVGLVHAVAYSVIVTLLESIAHIEHTLLLTDNVYRTVVVLLAYPVLDFLKVGHLCVAQCLYAECTGHVLA